jgi:hypothetical protein
VLEVGQASSTPLTAVLPQARFHVKQSGQSQEVSLDQAQFCLDIVPTRGKAGRTSLQLTPKVQHGQPTFPIRVANDYTEWVPDTDKPSKVFPELTWQVSLGADELLVIGANLDRPASLGYRSFVQDEGAAPMQRVLILRTRRALAGEDGEPTLAELVRNVQAPPLALQAMQANVRR